MHNIFTLDQRFGPQVTEGFCNIGIASLSPLPRHKLKLLLSSFKLSSGSASHVRRHLLATPGLTTRIRGIQYFVRRICMNPSGRLFVTFLVFLLVSVTQASSQPIFLNVAPQVGITQVWEKGAACWPAVASGSAWGDYDNDGDADLFVTNSGGPNYLFRNDSDLNGDGLPDFTDVAAAAGVSSPATDCHSCTFIDYDNDGDEDLFVTKWGANSLYRNQLIETGAAVFEDVTTSSGIYSTSRCITSAWGDYNGDGFLDLYLSNYWLCLLENDMSLDFLYKNNGDGTFEDVTRFLCPDSCSALNGLTFSAGWTDYDNDGDLDVYAVNDYITRTTWPNILWRNDGPDGSGGWLFTDASVLSGANLAINSMGLGVGDYDNDGWIDFAISNIGPNKLLHNNGDGTFSDVSAAAGIERAITPGGAESITWGTVFFDHDNDRWLDLYFVAGMISGAAVPQPNAFFHNNANGTFEDVSLESGLDDTLRGRSASIADFDEDGFVDVFVGNLNWKDIGSTTPFLLFHNGSRNLGNAHHWLTVTVEGTVSNRDGIGTRLYLTAPDGTKQMREITSGPTYGGGDQRAGFFGLGEDNTGVLTVRWPTGVVEDLGTVTADQRLHVVEMGTLSVSGRDPIVSQYQLSQNYPNPFNPSTKIRFTIQESGFASLKVFDVLGKEVATLVNGELKAGSHEVTLDAARLAAGVYLYRLDAGSFRDVKRLVVLK